MKQPTMRQLMGGNHLQPQPAELVYRDAVSASWPPLDWSRRADSAGCCSSRRSQLTTTSAKARKADVVPDESPDFGVPATVSVLDQRSAELVAAEKAATEALADEQSLAAQVRTYEQKVRQADPDVDPGQLVELTALHRFAQLRIEAAQDRVSEASRQHDAAAARVAIAEYRQYLATDEAEFIAAYWSAVDALLRLRRLNLARTEAAESFKSKRDRARHTLVAAGDMDALAALNALPSIDVRAVRGAIEALAIRQGLAVYGDDRDWHFVTQLPLTVPNLAQLPLLTERASNA
jgi:hypothetical protein